jgi:hypothetical protein
MSLNETRGWKYVGSETEGDETKNETYSETFV